MPFLRNLQLFKRKLHAKTLTGNIHASDVGGHSAAKRDDIDRFALRSEAEFAKQVLAARLQCPGHHRYPGGNEQ